MIVLKNVTTGISIIKNKCSKLRNPPMFFLPRYTSKVPGCENQTYPETTQNIDFCTLLSVNITI